MGKVLAAFFLAVLIGGLHFTPQSVLALSDPDEITLEWIRQYDDVAVEGDSLIVVHYNIAYSVTPDESIFEGYIGRVLDVGGAGQIASVNPRAATPIPTKGYDHGLYSFYFTTKPVPTGTLTVTLEGNPGLSPTPVGVTSSSIQERDTALLLADMKVLALHFSSQWDEDVIQSGILTTAGANYFLAEVPDLRIYTPSLFQLGVLPVNPEEYQDPIDDTYKDSLDSFWDNTPVGGFFDAWADVLNLPRKAVELILVSVVIFMICAPIVKWAGTPEPAILVGSLGYISAGVMGLGPIELVYTMAAVAILIVGYMMFFRPAGA